MNKYIYIIAAAISLSLSSCSDFLIEEPRGSLSKADVYKSITSSEQAVLGVYESVANPWSSLYTRIGNYSDDLSVPKWANQSAYFGNFVGSYTSTSEDVYNLWRLSYKAIVDANDCINNISKIEVVEGSADEYNKQRFIAECKFLRAFVYLDLVQLYGSVPLYLESESFYSDDIDIYVERDPASAVLQQVILDGVEAYEALPELSSLGKGGRASKYAVAMLLAKAYMLRAGHYVDAETGVKDDYFAQGDPLKGKEDYQRAAYYLSKIVSSGMYDLAQPNLNSSDPIEYGKIFLKSRRNEVASEWIFDLQFLGPDRMSDWGLRSLDGDGKMREDLGFYFLYLGAMVTSEFAMSYHDDDRRFYWNVGAYKYDNGELTPTAIQMSMWRHSKFRLESRNRSQNAPVYRYADVLLMLAEVSNELSEDPALAPSPFDFKDESVILKEPYAYINQVRERAGLVDDLVDDEHLLAINPVVEMGSVEPTMDNFGWIYLDNINRDFDPEIPTPGYSKRHVYYRDLNNPQSKKELFRKALQMERAWELCYERHRWFDLKRWGLLYERVSGLLEGCGNIALDMTQGFTDKSRLVLYKPNSPGHLEDYHRTGTNAAGASFGDVAITTYRDYYRYLPIPATEMQVNSKLTQNYGY